ncbi:PTS sugar transporter subunit IIB [Faecalicoccus pleomorphus]|uniref:PTS sugar transporter subunit IIB n=1 Tax=Faecalicoccus pleomorphus TaxID=1323 RepID=A0A7X9NHK6_9FIRM|nr:PTS sugar transporter subunit IIB [Faecalicoccus pleomorphus]NME44432.1 PTS sugar transporter subunit IIB [Faecalicoccus pleomorphus]
MAGIKLARVDFRLMHGQVVTTWIQQVSANAILIIDDKLASDKFLAQVFLMAAPPGIKIAIKSIKKAVAGVEKGAYNHLDLLVLFKSVENAKKAIDAGFPVESLQIGGLGSGTDKVMISNEISLSQKEADMLEELNNRGIKVTLQVTPKDPLITLEEALKEVRK